MQRAFLSVLLVCGAWTSAAAADSLHYRYRFATQSLQIQANGPTTTVHAGDLPRTWEQDRPRIPHDVVTLIIPRDSRIKRVVARRVGERLVSNGVRLPAAGAIVDDTGAVAHPKRARQPLAGLSPASYPDAAAAVSGSGTLHGYRMASLYVYPVRYEIDTGRLWTAEAVDIEVELAPDEPATVDRQRFSAAIEFTARKMVANLADNPEAIESYERPIGVRVEQDRRGFSPTDAPSLEGSPVDYVVITSQALETSFQPLVDWKTRRGVPAVIRTIEWILANYRRGSDLQESIRTFIQDAYAKWGVQWVVLGGDTDVVPARFASTSFTPTEDSIPTDMYYACLDGNWNADGDHLWAEAAVDSANSVDDTDMLAEVFVGRLPVSTNSEATALINKIISYEISAGSPYQQELLLLGEELFPGFDGGSFSEILVNDYVPGCVNATKLYENWTEFPGSQQLTLQATIDAMNSSVGFVNHIGHGFRYNMSCGDMSMVTSDAQALANGVDRFVLYMLNCTATAFDFPCLAEFFLKAGGGAVAVLGASRGAFPVPSFDYNKGFFQAIYQDSTTNLGQAFVDSRLAFTPMTALDTGHRYTHFIYNMLGDPEMPMHTCTLGSTAASFPSNVPLGLTNIAVNVTVDAVPREGALVCLLKGVEEYVTGVTDASGDVTLEFVAETPGTIDVTVSGHNMQTLLGSLSVDPSSSAYVHAQTLVLDDDLNGLSNGNSDGVLDAGEVIELDVTFANDGGDVANGAFGTFHIDSPWATVLDSTYSLGNIAASGSGSSNGQLRFSVDPNAPDGTVLPFRFESGASFLQADFDAGEDGFTYADDTFRGTSEPTYADGAHLPGGGFSGGGLQVNLGGINGDNIQGMSGGWQKTFNLSEASNVTLSLRYNLTQSPDYESDEFSEMLVSLDGVLYGEPPNDYVAQVAGNGGGGSPVSTGWQTWQVDFGVLTAGNHTLVLGGYNNEKTATNESTEILIDDVSLSAGASTSWTDVVNQVVHAPAMELTLVDVDDYAPGGNDDGIIQAGETFDLLVYFKNYGTGAADGMQATLSTSDPDLTLVTDWVQVGRAEPVEEITSGTPFRLTENVLEENTITLVLIDNYGRQLTRNITLREPGAPAGMWVDASEGADIVAVAWTPNVEADLAGYHLYRGLSASGPWTRVTVDRTVGVAYFRDTGLAPSTKYFFHATAVDSSGNESLPSAVVDINTNPAQLPGWPIIMASSSSCPPAVGDITGDASKEIVAGNSNLYAWNNDSSELLDADDDPVTWGVFATTQTITAAIALAELDPAPGLEVFAGVWSDGNKAYVVRGDGTYPSGWPQNPDSTSGQKGYWGSPGAADLDGDGVAELFAPAKNGNLYAWHADGSPVGATAAFKSGLGITSRASPTFANLDGDPFPEIVYGAPDGTLYVWKADGTDLPGFPVNLGGNCLSSTAIGDVDNDGIRDIVMITEGGNVNVIDSSNGTQLTGWPVALSIASVPISPSPALADFDDDGFLEIVVANNASITSNCAVRIFDHQGTVLAGWPQFVNSSTSESSPIVVDVSGDGVPDVLFGNESGFIFGWDMSGNELVGFPLTIGDFIRATPLADDVDSDGDIDLVLSGWDQNLWIWDFTAPYVASAAHWPTLKHDVQRTGNFDFAGPVATDVRDDVGTEPPPRRATLAQNVPNPFNPITSIEYGVPVSAGAARQPVQIDVYDVAGRRVRELVHGLQAPGVYRAIWDGRDAGGRRVQSGVYFYRLRVDGQSVTRKMLLLQ